MVPLDATATPLRKYSAEIVATEIFYHGRTYRAGDRIEIVGSDVHWLREAGVIGDIRRLPMEVETAVVGPPEDASKNYRRRPR